MLMLLLWVSVTEDNTIYFAPYYVVREEARRGAPGMNSTTGMSLLSIQIVSQMSVLEYALFLECLCFWSVCFARCTSFKR